MNQPPTSLATRRGLWQAVAAALVLHATGLVALNRPLGAPPGNDAPSIAALRSIQTTRVVSVVDPPHVGTDDPGRPRARDASSAGPTEPASPPAAETGEASSASAAVSGPDIPHEYFGRDQLTEAPVVRTAVLLTFPDDAPPGRFRSVLTLFIDETGTVRRIRFNGPDLPVSLQESARQAFMAARFSPGLIGSRAVKSRLEIEVEFAQDAEAGRRSL